LLFLLLLLLLFGAGGGEGGGAAVEMYNSGVGRRLWDRGVNGRTVNEFLTVIIMLIILSHGSWD